MKKTLLSVIAGAAIGTIVAILIAFSFMDGTIPFKSADVFCFVIATLAIIVGIRWRNTAQFARNTMVRKGLLKSNSARGIWEITEAGRRFLKTFS